MPTFTVFIVFDSFEHCWEIRRARTVVATCATREDAIRRACEIAVPLRQRMHCNMHIKIQDGDGHEDECALGDDRRSAATMALGMLHMFRAGVRDGADRDRQSIARAVHQVGFHA